MNNIKIKQLESQIINSSQNNRKMNNISNKNFEEILEKNKKNKNNEIKFSKHAISRIDTRNIQLSEDELEQLKIGFNKAEEKGIKDALIFVGDKAFIASIKNKTIITTFSKEQLKKQCIY